MTTALHLDSSGRFDGSRSLTEEVARRVGGDGAEIIRRDLADEPPAFVDQDWIFVNFTPEVERSTEQQAALAASDGLVSELQAADVLVLGVPIYNFGVPAAFKVWIDQVARARITFRYKKDGPVGLLQGKKATSSTRPVAHGSAPTSTTPATTPVTSSASSASPTSRRSPPTV